MVRDATKEGEGGDDEGTAANAKAARGEAGEEADEGIESGAGGHEGNDSQAGGNWQAGIGLFRRLAKGRGIALPNQFYAKTFIFVSDGIRGVMGCRLCGERSKGSPFCGGGGKRD